MAIEAEPTALVYTYKGCRCRVFSAARLGEELQLLLSQVEEHVHEHGKKGVHLLDMNEVTFRLPYDFAMVDKEEPEYFVVLADLRQAYPFHLAHELVHLLPGFYDIDRCGLLRVDGKPLETWPLLAMCVRRIEHLLTDIHVDAEVVARGIQIEAHFAEQVGLALPIRTTPEATLDMYDRVRAATNYLQCRYQVLSASTRAHPCEAQKALLQQVDGDMMGRWPYSWGIACFLNKSIMDEGFLDAYDAGKFGRIVDKAIVMLRAVQVPGPTVQWE